MKQLLKIIIPSIGTGGLFKYTVLGILSGLCGFLFINSVTHVVSLIIAGSYTGISKEYIILFGCIIFFTIWIRRTLSLAVIKLSQVLFWNLRMKVLTLVLNANYQQLESRKIEIHTALLSDVNILTGASMSIIDFFTAVILAISCLFYLSTISMQLFLVTLAVAFAGITIYHFSSKKNVKDFQKARNLEDKFKEYFDAMLDGFKEIFIEPRKGQALYKDKLLDVASEAYRNNTAAFTGYLNNQITGQILFYILISAVLLFFSTSLKIKSADIVSFIFTLLYLLSSIETIMVLLPSLARSRIASRHLLKLKDELENARFDNPVPKKYILRSEFDQLSVKGLEFRYGSQKNDFGIGPINFDVLKGDVVFIYGGNGSGKTTFIYSVLGLCSPTAGEIKLNDIVINDQNYPEYRTIFSVVFSNFYLFNEILGIEHFKEEKFNYYLQLFELEKKVKMNGRALSTTDLSTGQRKRLALIVILMEEKPVLVMDEWAADQDPHFRKKFYMEIIPLLKKEGVTIIAITHDDKYYHVADKLYRMDYGKLTEENVMVQERAEII